MMPRRRAALSLGLAVLSPLASSPRAFAASCLQPWCAGIGAQAGHRCTTLYPEQCGGCAEPACGAPEGGCLQPWCAEVGARLDTGVGEDCRTIYPGPCGGCASAQCTREGSGHDDPGPEARDVTASCPQLRNHVLIVLDASESMTAFANPPGDFARSRWSYAVEALHALVVEACRDPVRFGLMLFPTADPAQCGVALTPDVAIGAPPENIVRVADERIPFGGSPIAETIASAASTLALQPTADYHTIVLISDGNQTCAPADPATAISNARRIGVRTIVVGFTNASDPRQADELDIMAQAGGLARSQRAPSDHYFYDATDATQLARVLTDEVCPALARVERCDRCDNDGDELVDESPDVDGDAPGGECANLCGVPGREVCYQGLWLCEPAPLPEEVFDCVDNDCDGAIDEGTSPAVCRDEMLCRIGYEHCQAGALQCALEAPWVDGDCACPQGPCVEICANGVDDDCDATPDGLEAQCVAEHCVVRTAGEGAARGTMLCSVAPECRERCDGEDNDGDGVADEVEEASAPYTPCRERGASGAMIESTLTCGLDLKGVPALLCGEVALPAQIPEDVRDDCDGIDNDMDGETDESFFALPLEARLCHRAGDNQNLPVEVSGTGRLYCHTDCDVRVGARLVCTAPGLARRCVACAGDARVQRCEPIPGRCMHQGGATDFGLLVVSELCVEPRARIEDGRVSVSMVDGTPRCLPRCDGGFEDECVASDEALGCWACDAENRAGLQVQRCEGRRQLP